MSILGKSDLTIFVQFLCISFFYIPLSKLRALHERDLSFYKANTPIVIGHLVGGLLAIVLAMKGYGIWSLLWWKICTLFVEIIILWSISSYMPKFSFDKEICKDIVDYGKPLLFSSILVYVYSHFDYYIVDSLTSVSQLGYYWLAFQVSHYFLNARTAINKVVFPALSRLNNKRDRYEAFDIMTNIVSFIYLVPTVIVILFGKEIITSVYGVKWLPAATAFQVFFVIVLVKAIASNAGPLLHTEGNTNADFKLSIINLVMIIPVVYFGTLYGGIVGASIGILLAGFISVIAAYSWFVKPITGNGFYYYLWKPLFIVFVAVTALYALNWFMFDFSVKVICLFILLLVILKLYGSIIQMVYKLCLRVF